MKMQTTLPVSTMVLPTETRTIQAISEDTVGRTKQSSSLLSSSTNSNNNPVLSSLHQTLKYKITTWEGRNTIATILVLLLCTKDIQAISSNISSTHNTINFTTVVNRLCTTEFIRMACTPTCIITTIIIPLRAVQDLLMYKINTTATPTIGFPLVTLIEPEVTVKCILMVILNIISSTCNINRMVTDNLFLTHHLLFEPQGTAFSFQNTTRVALRAI
jgi:hypothetical protein